MRGGLKGIYMFKLSKDYASNGVRLEQGRYSQEELIKLYGSKETFSFCLTCTDLGDYLKKVDNSAEELEEKAIAQSPENKAISHAPENKVRSFNFNSFMKRKK